MEQTFETKNDISETTRETAADGACENDAASTEEIMPEASDFEEFLKQFPDADAEETIKGVIESGDFKKGGFTRQYVKSLKQEAERLKRENDSEEVLVKKAMENKAVSEEIVKAYLMKISENKKAVEKRINGIAPAVPPIKPRTVSEAGKLANEIFVNNLK